jgi:probable F420-dependent oxidoreductase
MTSPTYRHGVISILDNLPAPALIECVQGIEALGYGSYWIPELFGREPIATAAYLLSHTREINVATGIANIYARDPYAMVQARHTLSELSGGRFILGLGVSNVGLVGARGHAWQPPLRKLSKYLDDMAAITPDGAAASTTAPMHIAAHGPKLQALASARSDGVITYLMSPAHTRLSRQRIGSEAGLDVVCMMLAEKDATRARAVARQALAYYLTLDYYHREWRELGFSDADFEDGGSDELIDMLVGWGDADALHAHIAEHLDAGASRILVMPLDLGTDNISTSKTLQVLSPKQR